MTPDLFSYTSRTRLSWNKSKGAFQKPTHLLEVIQNDPLHLESSLSVQNILCTLSYCRPNNGCMGQFSHMMVSKIHRQPCASGLQKGPWVSSWLHFFKIFLPLFSPGFRCDVWARSLQNRSLTMTLYQLPKLFAFLSAFKVHSPNSGKL